MSRGFKNIKWKHYANYIVIAILTIMFAVMSMSGSLTSSTIYLLEKIAIAVLLSVSLSVVVGFLGELSLDMQDLCALALIWAARHPAS